MMSTILITGSIAYDHVMTYPGRFAEHIMPDQLHKLSVCFVGDAMVKRHGGTGLNVCYNLSMLGQEADLLASAGYDFVLPQLPGICFDQVSKHDDLLTASCHITTDADNNQITCFCPGAMNKAMQIAVPALGGEGGYLLVSANQPEAMVAYMSQGQELGYQTFFDPGQQLTNIGQADLRTCISSADYILVNDYEWELLQKQSGRGEEEIMSRVTGLITTMGADGSHYTSATEELFVPAIATEQVTDPTGAGDSYRAGVLAGLAQGKGWLEAMQMGTLCAHYCIQQSGCQEHRFSLEEFGAVYDKHFGI